MSEKLVDQFHQHIVSVYRFLQVLKFLYDEFGMDEMLELTDPSMEELESIVKELRIKVGQFDSQDDLLLQNRKISLEQSLLEAERLLIAVRKKNQEEFDQIGQNITPKG